MGIGYAPGPWDQTADHYQVADGTMCRVPSPTPGVLRGGPLALTHWDMRTKLLEAAKRATPKLPIEARAQFAALFTRANLGITAVVLAAWGSSHLVGVGEAADVILLGIGVVTIGWQAVGAGRDLGKYVYIAVRARTTADLDLAATYLARAVVTIGVTAFIALIMKAGSRLLGRGRVSARSATGSGEPLVPSTGEPGPWWKASDFGQNWPGTGVPRGFIMETGGQKFRVTINATEHMAEYAGQLQTAGQLKNPGVWSTSPGARFAEVDYPLSSLAGALEQAALKYGKLPPQRFPLERFGNWELGIDTNVRPWVVEHALPKGR